MAARCPTPFAFPFTPLGLSLFDIDPSRILSMLHHQTWLAEEALRNRGMLTSSKDLTQRFSALGDLSSKEFGTTALQTNANTADLHANATGASTFVKQQRSIPLQTQYKQQHPFNIPYPSTSLFYPQANPQPHQNHQPHHQHQQQQQHQHQQHQQHKYLKHKQAQRQSTPSPHRSIAMSTLIQASSQTGNALVEELRSKSNASTPQADDASIIELSSPSETGSSSIENLESGLTGALHFKDSLEQLLQRRHPSDATGIRSYTQLLFSNSTKTPPSFTDTSSCKEKSSSSSTSSTPPLPPPSSSSLITQHQQLSRMLKSPSDSSLLNEPIEEETRCIVCNAHFPNVWLLEQHAALQHPLLGPGEEKPFICEQCGQSYRYRSAYAKHKEQNHRARLPADKLFTCDVCGMQFRYLKSFKKHRLNHALERLHGKKGSKYTLGSQPEHEMVTSSQEAMLADEGEDLRISIKRERDDDDGERTQRSQRERDEHAENEQDSTIDSACVMHYNDNNSTTSNSTNLTEHNITSTDVINSSNKRHRLLTNPHLETDPSYQHHLQQQLTPHLQTTTMSPSMQSTHPLHAAATTSLNSLNSLNSITSLINAERLPSEQFLGLNPQEASILNFLRVDAAERQRDKRPLTSRFACPFCGKCVRSKENLKLHVRKHTGERPFVCLFCGRAFGGKSDLTRHLRIHTGERPYHCESCGKCFARADYLSKHLTTHVHNAPR